jgi:hypothetical protein
VLSGTLIQTASLPSPSGSFALSSSEVSPSEKARAEVQRAQSKFARVDSQAINLALLAWKPLSVRERRA